MSVIINIETSTDTCSAALTADGMVLTQRVQTGGRDHARLLADFVKDCMDHAERHGMRPDAVAVSLGPGSYTGLRIGLSLAKGLAYSLDIPLIGIGTLELLAAGMMFSPEFDKVTGDAPDDAMPLLVPMLDARRMEVYTAVYDMSLDPILQPCAMILDENSFAEYCDGSRPVVFFGNGSAKARTLLETRPGAVFIDNVVPLAADMLPLAERAMLKSEFIDTAYSTPVYLKEFEASKPKNPLQRV